MLSNSTTSTQVAALSSLLSELPRAAVAFSGGVDSSYLLAMCVRTLGLERTAAYTAVSPLLTARDLQNARLIAQQLGVALHEIAFNELTIPAVAHNAADRCYHCKYARFQALLNLIQPSGAVLLHGENADDGADYRPGSRAAHELGVRAPLAEVGMTKAEIRAEAHALGLANWNLPSDACLATRFPTNTPLTAEGLQRVQQAENIVSNLLPGVQCRVRDHGGLARIEVPAASLADVAGEPLRAQLVAQLSALGYRYVTLDLQGYRTGSTNEQRP